MKNSTIIGIVIFSILFIILVYSFSGSETKEQYVERINKEREDKDRFMRTSKSSPFKEHNVRYEGLKYFDPNPDYSITAKFTPIASRDALILPTSDNKSMRYRKYGYADFEMHGQQNRLLILELADGSENDGHIFIPFGDATSADQTYGAGRYLDIKHKNDEVVVKLDFNQSYNPYCAYSEKFSCPLPPVENLLIIPIQAGEKTYK